MEISYDCYAEHGLAGTGIKTVMDACGMSKASIYTHFDSIDDLILQSAACDDMLHNPLGVDDMLHNSSIDDMFHHTGFDDMLGF